MTRIESAAWNGEPLPKDADIFEELEYVNLFPMCRSCQSGIMPEEQLTECKVHLKNEIKNLKERYDFHIRLLEHTAERNKAMEATLNAYRTNRTLENADKLVAVLDGLEVVKDV